MRWYSSLYGFSLNITRKQLDGIPRSGRADESVAHLVKEKSIARQLDKIDPLQISRELKESGAWSAGDLQNDEANRMRLLWIAAMDLKEIKKNPRRVRHPRTLDRDKKRRPRIHIAGRTMRSRFTASRKTRITGDPRKLKKMLRKSGYRINPARSPRVKHICLQEKRGAAWVTLAIFPLEQKALAIRIGKQLHRRKPRAQLRLFS